MATPAPSPMSSRRTAMIGAGMVALGPVSLAIYTPALPTLVEHFRTTPALVQLTVSVYFFGFALAQLVCGPLSDAFGRRPVAMGFFGIYVLGSIVGVLAPSVEALLAGRALQGIGVTAGIGVGRALVRDQFSGQEAARILNLIGVMLGIGPAIAPTLGGALLSTLGWQAIFVAMLVYGAGVLVVLATLLRETNRAPNRAAAHPGRVLRNYRLLLADPGFRQAGLILACVVGGYYAVSMLLAFVLIGVLDLTPTQFGLTMLISVGCYTSGAMFNGWLMRRVDFRRSVTLGMGFILASILFYGPGIAVLSVSVASIMLPAAFWAFGVALVMPAMTALALEEFPHMAGSASAMAGFLQMAGGLLGSAVAALVFPDALTAIRVIMPILGLGAILLWAFARAGR